MPESKKKKNLKKKRKQLIRQLYISAAVFLLVGLIGLLLAKDNPGRPDETTTPPTAVIEPTRMPASEPTQTPPEENATESQPETQAEIQPEAEPQNTPIPDAQIPLAIYIPISGSQNRRIVNGFGSEWATGRDIDCFEVLLSEEKEENGSRFYEIFDRLWAAQPEAEGRRIGYELQLVMTDGSVKTYRILKPSDTEGELFEYVECYLYDDIHQNGAWNYYHLLTSTMKESTLMTSIKLHGGKQIAQVSDMQLTAFLYRDMNDFDGEGKYIGQNFWTIGIHKK